MLLQKKQSKNRVYKPEDKIRSEIKQSSRLYVIRVLITPNPLTRTDQNEIFNALNRIKIQNRVKQKTRPEISERERSSKAADFM